MHIGWIDRSSNDICRFLAMRSQTTIGHNCFGFDILKVIDNDDDEFFFLGTNAWKHPENERIELGASNIRIVNFQSFSFWILIMHLNFHVVAIRRNNNSTNSSVWHFFQVLFLVNLFNWPFRMQSKGSHWVRAYVWCCFVLFTHCLLCCSIVQSKENAELISASAAQ